MLDGRALLTKYRHRPAIVPAGFDPGFAGDIIRRSFEGVIAEKSEPAGEALFEWYALSRAVDAADQTFTMAEVGAGYGRWVVHGAVAARHAGLDVRLIAVEAEHSHFQMLRQHFLDNDIDPDRHTLIEAAVTDREREVYFVQGASQQWWGQSILPSAGYGYGDWPGCQVQTMCGLPLSSVLAEVDFVDFIDMDIQGAEADAVRGSLDTIGEKVRRIYIGTYNHEAEAELRSLFNSIGFNCEFDYPCNQVVETQFGTIHFKDGVQSWISGR